MCFENPRQNKADMKRIESDDKQINDIADNEERDSETSERDSNKSNDDWNKTK